MSDINVTPLVDVCLVLLIIFMVVTPMLQTGVPVQLPETGNPEKYPESAKQLKVTITEDGKIFMSKDDWVPIDGGAAAPHDRDARARLPTRRSSSRPTGASSTRTCARS